MLPAEMNVNLCSAKKMPASMEVYVFQWVMEFNVSVQQDFPEEDVKLTSMNVLLSRVIMVELVLIYHKAISVSVHQVILESTVRKKGRTVRTILVQLGQCAKMNRDTRIIHASADPVILESIVM